MGRIEIQDKITELYKKYRYVLVVILAGMLLLLLPEREDKQESIQIQPETSIQGSVSLQESLSEILSKIQGAGKVEVLLSQAAGERILYQSDEDSVSSASGMDMRQETVIISGANREEAGLIQQIQPPVYQGAIVLCQGADSASVRLSIVEAVANATGLSTDKITVLKMK